MAHRQFSTRAAAEKFEASLKRKGIRIVHFTKWHSKYIVGWGKKNLMPGSELVKKRRKTILCSHKRIYHENELTTNKWIAEIGFNEGGGVAVDFHTKQDALTWANQFKVKTKKTRRRKK